MLAISVSADASSRKVQPSRRAHHIEGDTVRFEIAGEGEPASSPSPPFIAARSRTGALQVRTMRSAVGSSSSMTRISGRLSGVLSAEYEYW